MRKTAAGRAFPRFFSLSLTPPKKKSSATIARSANLIIIVTAFSSSRNVFSRLHRVIYGFG
jgi:hypothetical protein